MTPPAVEPQAEPRLAPGDGVVRAEFVAGRTALTRLAARSPLKFLAPRRGDGSARVFASSYGGGLLGGDRLALRVTVGPRASLVLGTQASTKVYRTGNGRAAEQTLVAQLDEDASLFVLPDPITPFADSIYSQQQTVRMSPSSSLVLLDWLTAGRTAAGERWAFERYESHTDIWLSDSCAYADGLLLDPRHGPIDASHRMGRFNCLATVLLLGESLREHCVHLHATTRHEGLPRRADTLCVTSEIDGGLVLRIAGVRTEDVARQLQRRLAFVEQAVGGYWARKW